jgi:hypothetical protein
MMYGNYHTGYGYSPDRSRDVDRFNPSTKSNYTTTTYYGSIANSRESSTPAYTYYDPCKPYYSNR